MARGTDVGGRSTGAPWRAPLAGGRPLARAIAEHRLEQAKQAAHAQTTTLDDVGHLIARLEWDSQHLCEHLRRLKDITNEPHVAEALRIANLPEEEAT